MSLSGFCSACPSFYLSCPACRWAHPASCWSRLPQAMRTNHIHTTLTLILPRPARPVPCLPRQTSPHKPIHQRHRPTDTYPYSHTNQSTNDTVQHTPQIPHSTDTTPIQPHKHTTTQTPTRRSHGPTDVDVVDALDVDVDALAAPMQSQPTASLQLDRPGRQDQTKPD